MSNGEQATGPGRTGSAQGGGRRPVALAIKHDPYAFPGYVGERLRERGFDIVELEVTQSMDEPNPSVDFGDPTDVDLVVSLGAVWSVYDRDTIGNWIDDELDYLRAAMDADVPVFGICFGGQALSAALGGTVEKSPKPEVGWQRVRAVDGADVLSSGPWMEWHFDRFSVPDEAEALAENDAGNQAFSHGRSLGLQFHPEVSVEIVRTWIDSSGPDGPELPAGVDLDTVMAQTERNAPGARVRTHALVDWFLDDIARFDGLDGSDDAASAPTDAPAPTDVGTGVRS